MQRKIILFASLLFVSCQSTSKKDFATPNNFQHPKILINEAEVKNPAISSDGEKIVYIQNTNGNNTQIFIHDAKKDEKRQITHQVGNITEVGFYPGERKILYTSTTDEDKENPKFLKAHLYPEKDFEDQMNTEIYLSNLYGGDIIRLTNHEGFDGYFDIHPASGELIYTEKNITFYRLRKGKNQNYKVFKSSKANEKLPKFSPNGNHLVWFREKDGEYELKILGQYDKSNKDRSVLMNQFSSVQSLSFHPQSEWLIFSAVKKDEENTDIYTYNIITECMLRMTYYPGEDIDPIFHPDGNRWIFVSNRDGARRIYESSYWPKSQCNLEEEDS